MDIKINVNKLDLRSEEYGLSYKPFTITLNSSRPSCRVVGPSGSGKTTFFKSLMPIFIKDWQEYEDVNHDIIIHRRELDFHKTNGKIGYAAQRPFFIAHRSVRSNLTEPFKWNGKQPPPDHKINEIVNDFQLSSIIDRAAYKLSNGERQRLNLARMFITEPELAIIDESLAALDEDLCGQITRTIAEKYLTSSRLLITSHRSQDLNEFSYFSLIFQCTEKTNPHPHKEISVEVKDEEE